MNKKKILSILSGALVLFGFFGSNIAMAADTVVMDVEAESGSLTSPMARRTFEGRSHISTNTSEQGSVKYTFSAPAGTYKIMGKTYATADNADSFTVKVDGQNLGVWDVPHNSTWTWNTVDTRDAGATIELGSGSHTITIGGRERNTMIDRVKVVQVSTSGGGTNPNPNPNPDPNPNPNPQPNSSTVLYVNPSSGSDSNNGSSGHPFKTVQKALDVVRPGMKIQLYSGTYKEAIETKVDGTASNPIVIEPVSGNTPVFDLGWTLNAPRLVNDYYTFRNIEVRRFNQGIRIEEAQGVTVEGVNLHHGKHECLRVRHFARNNTIKNNTIHFCGASSDTQRISSGNGEGIYIGTAPEQRSRNGGQPDTSTGNKVIGNTVYDTPEAIDIKEDASNTLIEGNHVHHLSDVNSGAINIRADGVTLKNNISENNAGSGFRFGGDVVSSPEFGANHHYGSNNTLRNNVSRNNAEYGYKFMWGPQDIDCSNTATGNGNGMTRDAEISTNFIPSCLAA